MRKFKIFFYPFYIIIALIILYFSIDMLMNMEAYKSKMTFGDLMKAPNYVLSVFVFLVVLMLTEIIVENSHIINLKSRLNKLEKEVLNLKAKLYDQSQAAIPKIEEAPETEEEPED